MSWNWVGRGGGGAVGCWNGWGVGGVGIFLEMCDRTELAGNLRELVVVVEDPNAEEPDSGLPWEEARRGVRARYAR
jgi:hypothetical protein